MKTSKEKVLELLEKETKLSHSLAIDKLFNSGWLDNEKQSELNKHNNRVSIIREILDTCF
jgi:hypothetical protein